MGKFDYRKYISENKFSIGKVKSKNFENSTIINEDGRFIQDRKGPNFSDLAIKAKSLEDFIQQYKADEVGKNRFNSKQNFPNEKEFYKAAQKFYETTNGTYPNFNTGNGSWGPDKSNAETIAKKYESLDVYLDYMYKTFKTLETTKSMKDRLSKIHEFFHPPVSVAFNTVDQLNNAIKQIKMHNYRNLEIEFQVGSKTYNSAVVSKLSDDGKIKIELK
jgi:hypothetical protein